MAETNPIYVSVLTNSISLEIERKCWELNARNIKLFLLQASDIGSWDENI